MDQTFIKIGQIINTHGHEGGLKIYPLTDDPQRFFDLQRVFIQNHVYTIKNLRLHQKFVLVDLQEIPDMNEAEKLKGLYLEIPREEVRSLPEGSFYIFQLVGLAVYEDGQLLGRLINVLQTGSNDVYVVQTSEDREIYLPALKSVVTRVDLEAGRMEVVLPAGLLD